MIDLMLRRAKKEENIVKTNDPSVCPRCGSTEVNWVGGDMDGIGGYYDMYVCEECGRLPKGVQVFLVPVSEKDYGTSPWKRGLSLEERIPRCHIHGIRMSPVSWEINSDGKTTGTDYVCLKCSKERKPSDPVCLTSGPIIPYYREGVFDANGERMPY